MTEKKSRLGRGLEALLGGEEMAVAEVGRNAVPVELIEKNPFQPRKTFDDDELSSLCDSIRTHGILQPLVVRQVGDRFQLIAGERRLRAAQAAGLSAVPVTIVDFNDQQTLEAALVENIQRTDLNPIDKAQGFSEYLNRYQMTHEQLAGRLGLGRATITNLVALLDLPAELQGLVRDGQLSVGHAKALKGIADPQRQISLGKEIIARGLSVHATEAHVKQMHAEEKAGGASNGSAESSRTVPEKTAHVQSVEDDLRQKLGMKVEIKVKGKDRGQILFTFECNDDFERLVEVLRK
jgi:ParB family transcriptional regulator, chromosome partitioning protein